MLKAADLCAVEPDRVARLVAEKRLTSYDNARQMLREIPYGKWREYDVEDSLRFFTLRMREVGVIRTTPQKIITDGTDLRFLNQLRKELKV